MAPPGSRLIASMCVRARAGDTEPVTGESMQASQSVPLPGPVHGVDHSQGLIHSTPMG